MLADQGRSDRDIALAGWLLGRAQNEVGEVTSARETLETARHLATEIGEHAMAAQIAVSEAACLVGEGRTGDGFARLADAEAHLSGGALGRLVMQRGLLELHRGDLPAASREFDAAEPLLIAAGDEVALARLLANRGATLTQLGALARAQDDLERCREVAGTTGLSLIRAGAAHNLGFLSGQLGDSPLALRWYGIARAEYEELGLPRRPVAILELDLCTTMSMCGLTDEAIDAGLRAVESATEAGDRITLGDALLQLALAQTAAGRIEAVATARRATTVLAEDERQPFAALARYVETKARSGGAHPGAPSDLRSAEVVDLQELIEVLEHHGWSSEADDVRLFAAERLLDGAAAGHRLAARLLDVVSEARRDERWHRRVTGWYAEALRRRRTDPAGASRALLVGVRIADAHRSSLAAADLRAHLSTHTTALLQLGCDLALERGDPDDVVAWVDRAHAPSLAMRPVRPPDDPRLAELLTELRRAHERGEPARIGDLEARIRSATRTVEATRQRSSRSAPRRLADAFGAASLVEFGTVGGELIAVTVVAGRAAVRRLGSPRAVDAPSSYAGAALRRLSRSTTSALAADAAIASLDDAAGELDRLLIAPLDLPPDSALVIVPDASHHSVPWAALPALAARPWVLSPSAATWATPRTRPASDRPSIAMVAGPRLAGADDEVARLAAIWGERASVLTSHTSTVAATIDELQRVDVAHFAAHGTFRSDSPSFSAIHVADGHLTVYDLESIADPPHVVVLAACDLALMAVRGAGDVLGTAAALLHLGVGSVVAPVVTIADRAATTVMLDLHELLRDGIDPATAMMHVRLRHLGGDDRTITAAARSLTVISADPDVPRSR